MADLHSSQIYAEGLAIAIYGTDPSKAVFKHWDEELAIPLDSVRWSYYKAGIRVAKWSDVLKAANG